MKKIHINTEKNAKIADNAVKYDNLNAKMSNIVANKPVKNNRLKETSPPIRV